MQEYNYWGFGKNEPPPNLKTKKQLREMGLSPLEPVGVIKTPKYNLYLYDPDSLTSVRPKSKCSQKQLENLDIGRQSQIRKSKYRTWYRNGGFIQKDRAEVVKWVHEFVENDYVIFDTETTGLDSDAEVIEIAVINPQGEALLDTLVRPTIPISTDAAAVHGISDEMVSSAPGFPEIYPQLKSVLADKQIAIYNDDFDKRVLNYCCQLHQLPLLSFKGRTVCLMEWYAQWYGEYSSYWRDYKWQPLGGGHRALGDCLQALSLLQEIAADDPVFRVPDFLEDK